MKQSDGTIHTLIRPLTDAENKSEAKKRKAWQTLLSLGVEVVFKPYDAEGKRFPAFYQVAR